MVTGPRPGNKHLEDRWIHGVLPLGGLHAALYLTLQARPGPVAIVLWRWGPPLLVAAAAALLLAALVNALRGRQVFSWRRAAGLAGLAALLGSMGLYRTFPSEHDGTPSPVVMRLPLDGPVRVAWGGRRARANYHVGSPAERWGYDLLVTREGDSHQGAGEAVSDYHAYGLPVLAPAPGRVADVHDGDPDAAPGRPEPVRRGGNRIVLEVAPGQYLFLLHLKAGSIRVEIGDRVKAGQVVASVGNSGNSTEPHLHLHLQDSPAFETGQGIPFYFANYVEVGTGAFVTRGMPEGGVERGRHVGDVVRAEVPGAQGQ
jgi:murein DD-endopeptidase MepM/ murein hydrolase activator NlpD